ncbi:MmcQ/YjbR family DNA-binding protein [Arcicella rosea]|uniref:Putative DNA-binding protein (MmcQ/YjbR family) n=1 Tax=Arcicella rosea TaxID=502909 RepID=A0A841EVE1_9BACT|nr:MmcQ/YjbR family DNA-binding protein [Arcicella rosea]MBB6004608.1 putative DNA-binding protein (MmcQ/YjbR family) [Arcicella rosea]
MNIEEFRDFCLSLKGVTEELPFGPDTLVYKVMGKMFALTGLDSELFTVNLKCDPDRAIQLREDFHYIIPGYHMNKKHWNTVNADIASTVQVKELTEHSYQLVVASLPKKVQVEFQNL